VAADIDCDAVVAEANWYEAIVAKISPNDRRRSNNRRTANAADAAIAACRAW
jgi:hypothetical protein